MKVCSNTNIKNYNTFIREKTVSDNGNKPVTKTISNSASFKGLFGTHTADNFILKKNKIGGYINFQKELLSLRSEKTNDYLMPNYQVRNLINICDADASAYTPLKALAADKDLNVLLKFIDKNNYKAVLNDEVINLLRENIAGKEIKGIVNNIIDKNLVKIILESEKEIDFINVHDSDKDPKIRFEKIDRKPADSVLGYEISKHSTSVTENGNKIESYKGYETIDIGNYHQIMPVAQKKDIFDENSEIVYSETIKPSEANKNVCEITSYNKGELSKENYGTVTKEGDKKIVDRKFTSENGNRTEYKQILSDNQNALSYKITDKDNNILMEQTTKHTKIDDNHFKTSFKTANRDEIYEIDYSGDKIIIDKTDLKSGNKARSELDKNLIDKDLLDTFKKLPGNLIEKFQKNPKSIQLCKNDDLKNDSMYSIEDNCIYISQEFAKDPFVFAHEIGHVIDIDNLKISNDKNLLDIYKQELKEYRKNATNLDEGSIEYFSMCCSCPIREVVAESMALLSGNNTNKEFMSLRSTVLQQNFPKTIAFIAEKLQ